MKRRRTGSRASAAALTRSTFKQIMGALMQTVLLLGGSGRLGSALRARWDHVVAPPSSELDLRDDDAIARRIDELEPALIVNCAGLTDVDGCERDPQATDELNGYAPRTTRSSCGMAGVPCVYISTDYVFSGHPERSLAEEDALAPVNRYGQSKARGEGLVLDSGAQALVARSVALRRTQTGLRSLRARSLAQR